MSPVRIGRDDAGFTLLELVAVMAIGSVLMSIGAFNFANWRTQARHEGSADRLVSEFRRASVLAVSEGRTYCVELRPATVDSQLWRTACGSGTSIGRRIAAQSNNVTFSATVPAATVATPCPSSSKCLYFYPRGTATKSTVVVGSTRRTKTYTIEVEGLTSRVYR